MQIYKWHKTHLRFLTDKMVFSRSKLEIASHAQKWHFVDDVLLMKFDFLYFLYHENFVVNNLSAYIYNLPMVPQQQCGLFDNFIYRYILYIIQNGRLRKFAQMVILYRTISLIFKYNKYSILHDLWTQSLMFKEFYL